jgi:hypothetical protein
MGKEGGHTWLGLGTKYEWRRVCETPLVLSKIERSEEICFLGAGIIGNCLQIKLINRAVNF